MIIDSLILAYTIVYNCFTTMILQYSLQNISYLHFVHVFPPNFRGSASVTDLAVLQGSEVVALAFAGILSPPQPLWMPSEQNLMLPKISALLM